LFIPESNAGNVLASCNWLQLAQFIDKKGFECMTSFNNSTNTKRGENKRDVKNVFVFSRISDRDWETVFLFFLRKGVRVSTRTTGSGKNILQSDDT
jgi:hypothetical protein